MGITDQAMRALKGAVEYCMRDPRLVVSITLHHLGESTWSDTLNHNVTAYTDTVVQAMKLQHTRKSVSEANNPNIQEGDTVFVIRAQDCPDEDGINTQDMVLFGGQDYDIKDIDRRLEFAVKITVKGN